MKYFPIMPKSTELIPTCSLSKYLWNCFSGIYGKVASENYRCKIIHVIYRQKAVGSRKQKFIAFFSSRRMTRRYGSQDNWHSSPCLSHNFWTNEDKSKLLSSGYLVSLILVIWETINCQKWSFHQCCNAHNFCTFFEKVVYSKIVWVVAIMVPGQRKTTTPYLWQSQLVP